jgi:hypothetical protein
MLVAIAVIILVAPVSAQKRSTIDADALDAAVAMHVNPNRSVVTSALTSASVMRGALRVDVARGLTADRRWGLTAVLEQALPTLLRRVRH